MTFKPIDPKRDEYRRYLERGGIIESLTKIFVGILKERPEDPTQYLLQSLGDSRLQTDDVASLQNELKNTRMENQRLTEIIRSINPDLLTDSYSKDLPRDEPSLHDSGYSIESPEKSDPTNKTDFIQREEYTTISGTDDCVLPDAKVNSQPNNKA